MSESSELTELEKEEEELRKQINAKTSENRILLDQRDSIRAKMNKIKYSSFIGKFFKYHNCYSRPQKESDYWYLYYKVLSIDKDDFGFNTISFQKDSYGTIEFKRKIISFEMITKKMEISKEEFFSKYRELLKEIEIKEEKINEDLSHMNEFSHVR